MAIQARMDGLLSDEADDTRISLMFTNNFVIGTSIS